MKRVFNILAILLTVSFVLSSGGVANAAPARETKKLIMYMQMGGDAGAPSVLARTNGAKAAAAALGIELHEQYSSWDQPKMLDAFKQAIAAKPDCIEIMGHPGEDAMFPLVDQAEAAGIVVTSGNNPMPKIEAKYQSKGFGYAGADLYAGGFLTGQAEHEFFARPGADHLQIGFGYIGLDPDLG